MINELSFDVDENALAEIFGRYGNITKCKLVQAGGRSRGIAYVEHDDYASAAKTIAGEDHETHMGREITVEFSGNK